MKTFGDVNAAIEAMRTKRDAARQVADAAPELLDALKSMQNLWLSNCEMRGHSAESFAEYRSAIAAIRKATGEAA